jgi:hypothetical protein
MRFWRRKNDKFRKPGLTGTGDFIANLDWWLWDDLASPGLISVDRFEELRKLALGSDERERFSMILVRDTVVVRGKKQISSEDKEFAKYALQKVGNYLLRIRQNDFEQLSNWVGSNFMLYEDGWVRDQNGTKVNRDILRVVAAYINCLELWGFGYTWSNILNGENKPVLLIHRHGEPRFCLSQGEGNYVQGKPYRYSIDTKGAGWHFDSAYSSFEIRPRRGGELVIF